MVIPPIDRVRYEFDKTGKNPDNLVINEEHVLPDRMRRVIMPRHAHFYIDSVKILDKTTGNLVPRTSYIFDNDSEAIAMKTGLGASSLIIINDSSIGSNITVTYQAVGGEYSCVDIGKLQRRLEELNLDNRPVSWNDIYNKPDTYNPSEHLHPLWQTFGYEHLVYVVERLVQAHLVGDEQSHTVIWNAIRDLDEKFTRITNELRRDLTDHINDKDNPHEVTAEQVGTYTKGVIDSKISSMAASLRSEMKSMESSLSSKISSVESNLSNAIDSVKGDIGSLSDNVNSANDSLSNQMSNLGSSLSNQTSNVKNMLNNVAVVWAP